MRSGTIRHVNAFDFTPKRNKGRPGTYRNVNGFADDRRESERTNATASPGATKTPTIASYYVRELGRTRGGRRAHIADWQAWKKRDPMHDTFKIWASKETKKGAIEATAATEYLGHSPTHVLTKHNFMTAPPQVVHVSHRPGKPSKMNLRSKHDCTLSVDRPIRITR